MPDRKNGAGDAEEDDAEERDVDDASLDADPGPARPRPPSSSSCRSRSPAVLVLFRGLPGVGKSTLARAVALELRAPLLDKDDTRDALAEAFSEREKEGGGRGGGGEGGGEGGGGEHADDLFRQRLNEASYAAAFNAARTLFACSRCPCVLLDSPLSRSSAAERALRLAEELKEEGRGDDPDPVPVAVALVVVAVGTSDEGLWRRRLEARAAALAASGSFSARHKPVRWAEVEALRDRGRRELLEEGEKEETKKDSGGVGKRREGGSGGAAASSLPSSSSFKEGMLRDLGVDRPCSSSPFSRLWKTAFARFVVDTAAAGEEEGAKADAFSKAAAGRVADAVRSALAGKERSPPFDDDDDDDVDGNFVFIGR